MAEKSFHQSKYEMAWISVLVIFFGAIVYPIVFQIAKEKSIRMSMPTPVTEEYISTPPETATTTPAVVHPVSSASHFVFKRDLKQGDTGTDVKELQKYLNDRGFTVAQTGNGSPGHENEVFGPGTKAALKKFQETYAAILLTPYGLSEGTGFFGKVTRDFVNS
jgi:hypothetical protein